MAITFVTNVTSPVVSRIHMYIRMYICTYSTCKSTFVRMYYIGVLHADTYVYACVHIRCVKKGLCHSTP